MKLTSFYQKSTKYRALLSGTFFEKYPSTTGGTFDFQVPVPPVGLLLTKYRVLVPPVL